MSDALLSEESVSAAVEAALAAIDAAGDTAALKSARIAHTGESSRARPAQRDDPRPAAGREAGGRASSSARPAAG